MMTVVGEKMISAMNRSELRCQVLHLAQRAVASPLQTPDRRTHVRVAADVRRAVVVDDAGAPLESLAPEVDEGVIEFVRVDLARR